MYNIITTNDDKGNFKRVKCPDCGTIFVFNQEDVKAVFDEEMQAHCWCVECPVCAEKIYNTEGTEQEWIDSDFYGKEI